MTGTFQRPTALNYNETNKTRKALSEKADSVFSYRGVNPYSLVYDKFKRDSNENLDSNLWQEAANKGELDQYIAILSQNNKKSTKLNELVATYGDRVDYDTKMLALSYDTITNDEAVDRYDDAGNLVGTLTQKELIDKVLENQKARWDANIAQESEKSASFWKKIVNFYKGAYSEIGAFVIDTGAGLVRWENAAAQTLAAGSYAISKMTSADHWFTDKEIAEAYVEGLTIKNKTGSFGNMEHSTGLPTATDITNLQNWLSQQAYDIRRKYGITVDTATGEYNFVGQLLHGMADSLGYMLPALSTGNAAFMYFPMFTDNVKDNYQLRGANVDYSKIVTNAAIKAGAEYAIEWGLNKFLGSTVVNRLLGFGDDAAKVTAKAVVSGINATTKEATKQVVTSSIKQALQEGLEEVLQDTSGYFIDYLYGDDYRSRTKENLTLENYLQAFIVGAATSIGITTAQIAVTESFTGIAKDGSTYEMSAIQSYSYKRSLAILSEWQNIMNDKNAKVSDRIEAALKLETVSVTLGSIYESLGISNSTKADQLLVDIQNYHDRKVSIADKFTNNKYSESLIANLDNEVNGKNWTNAFNIVNAEVNNLQSGLAAAQSNINNAYKLFGKALTDKGVIEKLLAAGVSKVNTPIDLNESSDNSIFETAKKLGFEVIVPTDGRDVIVADDVIFTPESLVNGDTQTLLKEVITQKTIMNILQNMPAELLTVVIDTYRSVVNTTNYSEAEIATQAIAALMFDSSFQLKMLLQTKQSNSSYGIDNVIAFITNLKKFVAKSYVVDPDTKKRKLNDITKTITTRIVESLQNSIVLMNTINKRTTVNDPKTNKAVVKPEVEEVLTKEQVERIENDKNVQISNLLDSLENRVINEHTKNTITDLVDDIFDDLFKARTIAAIFDIDTEAADKIEKQVVVNKLLSILKDGTNYEVLSIRALLTSYFASSKTLSKDKIHYVSSDETNMTDFKEGLNAKNNIEATLLGNQTVAEVISGKVDFSIISEQVLSRQDDFTTNDVTRHLVLNELIKHQTNNQYTLLPDGQLAKANADYNDLNADLVEAINNKTLIDYISKLQSKAKDGIIRLQDLFSVKLAKKVGNIPVAVNVGKVISGAYQRNGIVHVELSSNYLDTANIAVILHESIHATNYTGIEDDLRYNEYGGGPSSIASQLDKAKIFDPEVVDSIVKYLQTNFKVLSRFIEVDYNLDRTNSRTNFAGEMIYYLLYQEVTARSVAAFSPFVTLGFTYKIKGNEMYLISPDGKDSWKLNNTTELAPVELQDIQAAVLKSYSDIESINAKLTDITNLPLDEIQDYLNTWMAEATQQATDVRFNYDDIVESIKNSIDATNLDKAGLFLLFSLFKSKKTVSPILASNRLTIGTANLVELIDSLGAIYTKVLNAKSTLPSDIIKQIADSYYNKVLTPLISLLKVSELHNALNVADLAASYRYVDPKSFEFGDYSFTKHTAKSYMLTQQLGKGKYITQEVSTETLMPVKANQTPILNDEALRSRFLFVIAKKTEAAKKAAETKEKEPVKKPIKKKEVKALETVWEWGQWSVKNYDKTHYIVSKGASADNNGKYEKIQIVSKETLLPDSMLGNDTKAILSNSERANLLEYIAENKTPMIFKNKDKATGEEKYKYIPNLNKPAKITTTDEFAAPNPYKGNRKYISNAKASKSNLKFFIKKGKPIQIHSDTAAFVEGTTDNFDKLSKFFQVRIKNGTLTHHDIVEYIATTKTINAYTWEAIAKYIYHNDVLAKIGPTIAKFFLDKDKLEKYAIMMRTLEDDEVSQKQMSLVDLKKLETEFNTKLKDDAEFYKKYEKVFKAASAWWEYDNSGKLVKRDDLIIDEKQLLPVFMKYYDGTLSSLNTVFTIAKTMAGKQLNTSILENTSASSDNDNANKTTKISSGNAAVENNAGAAKTKSGIYNWIQHIRQNIVDYEQTGFAPEFEQETMTFEDLSDDDKINLVYDFLYNDALAYTSKPSEQEEAEADQEVRDTIADMTDEEINKAVMFVLNTARNAIVPTEIKVIDPNAPARKTLKDSLRNKTRTLIRRLAGLKTNYNNLAPEVKSLINFSTNKSTINSEAYTNLSDEELTTLNETVASEIAKLKNIQKSAKDLEKVKNSIIRKVAALQNKERALAEREASIEARKKAIKEGKTLSEKISVTYDTKIKSEPFTITGPSQISYNLLAILNRVWDKTTTSKVKYMEDSVQTIQNVHTAEEFYKAHAAELSSMTLSEVEDVTDWLINSHINTTDSVAKQTYEATRFFILAFIYNETSVKGIFRQMNSNLKTQLGNYLKAVQTSAGTLLSLVSQVKSKLNPASIIITAMFDRFEYKLTEDEQMRLNDAFDTGSTIDIARVLHDIKNEALANLEPEKTSTLRKIAAIRSMSMISSPMTWLRNINSNIMLSGLTRIATKIGNSIFPKLTAKTEATKLQYKMNGKVTPEIQAFIVEHFIDSGFFDETLDQISKYNPSQVLRHQNVSKYDVIGDMLIHSIYNQYYSESMFDNKILNKIHTFLMHRLSDKNFVRKAAVRYIGKLLAETGAHLDANGNLKTGIDKDIMKVVADAYALSTEQYMHSDNFFSHTEQWLSQHSQAGWAAYKLVLPFATASWNWFKAAMRYSPVGLGQAIVRLTNLEQEIIKRETFWKKGESQISPELASYMVRRDLGSGIIGTISLGFGMILAALGYISLEDDDWGIPKLRVGNLRIDISTIFGSSSILAGAALIETMKTKDLAEGLDAMLEPLVNGFFFTDLLQMDANSPKGWFEWSVYQMQSIILSFLPSGVRYLSGMLYTGTYRTNTLFEKAVARIPFLGLAFNIQKKTNIYTGDSEGTFWDIVHRALPYFEIVTKSQSQELTESYGLNKSELNGTYTINGSPFTTDAEETARINKLYGTLNSDALTDFYSDKASYKVLTADNVYRTKYYSQMTDTEIRHALDQIFSKNSAIAKASAWLEAGHSFYTNDRDILLMLRSLGYSNVYVGNKGFVE